MLVFHYDGLNDDNLSKTFGEITWKYKIDELINKYFNSLNEIDDKEGYLTTVRTTNLSNELLETLKIIENCTSCKDNLGKLNLDKFHEEINDIEYYLTKLEEEEEEERDVIDKLNEKLTRI